jgi:exodeoxyribonuclease VII large subunit
MRVLERGFSLTQRADGHVVTSAADVRAGDKITVRVHDGGIDATVEGTHARGESASSARGEPSREGSGTLPRFPRK